MDSSARIAAQKMNIDEMEFERLVKEQYKEIDERAKFPTIEINTEEREALRNQIIADYFNEFSGAKKENTAIIVLGQIASGKSTFCKSLLENDHAFVVDSDFIKQGYGSMRGLKDDFDNGKGTTQVHEEASMLSKKIISLASEYGYNLVIPKTGVNYNSIENIVKNLKSKNYYVGMAYVDLPIKKCIQRNYDRYLNEMLSGSPSRLIPFEDIKAIDDNPFKTFARFLMNRDGLVNDFVAFSNDVGSGEAMKQISTEEIIQFVIENQLTFSW